MFLRKLFSHLSAEVVLVWFGGTAVIVTQYEILRGKYDGMKTKILKQTPSQENGRRYLKMFIPTIPRYVRSHKMLQNFAIVSHVTSYNCKKMVSTSSEDGE